MGQVQKKYGAQAYQKAVLIPPLDLAADLTLPASAQGVLIFAQDRQGSRASQYNLHVAEHLHAGGIGSFLMDLVTPGEAGDGERASDVGLLAGRLRQAVHWLDRQPETRKLPLAFFGAGSGTDVVFAAAAQEHQRISAIISLDDRLEIGTEAADALRIPMLFILGLQGWSNMQNDKAIFNQHCSSRNCIVIPQVSSLLEDADRFDLIADLTRGWLCKYLRASSYPYSRATSLRTA